MHFITGSSGKFAEVQSLIPSIEQVDFDLPEIQSTDAKEIIAAKLTAAEGHNLGEYIVEDTGLYLECLNGLPGPLIKWFLKKLGNEGLASLVNKYEDKTAYATTWIGYRSESGDIHYFEGSVKGTIVAPKGEGFGWDPIFQPDGHDRTYGEMTMEEKGQTSMRKAAVQKLVDFLGK
ncbi:MAG TPA: non-canonical purine NTP pyrophosphatase [Verrucomicrobiae bacterium]|nr:non-canonical purine NTP pyrophosphatase [Verrucomicrobiae bacterium]